MQPEKGAGGDFWSHGILRETATAGEKKRSIISSRQLALKRDKDCFKGVLEKRGRAIANGHGKGTNLKRVGQKLASKELSLKNPVPSGDNIEEAPNPKAIQGRRRERGARKKPKKKGGSWGVQGEPLFTVEEGVISKKKGEAIETQQSHNRDKKNLGKVLLKKKTRCCSRGGKDRT